MVVGTIGSLATPYVLKIVIDDIFPKGNFNDLVTLLGFLLGVYILRIVCSLIIDVLNISISQKIVADIRNDILASTLKKPITFFREINHGELIFTVTNDVHVIQNALSSLITNLLNDSLNVIGILIMLAILNLKLTLISLIIIPFMIISIRKFTPVLQRSFRKVQETEEVLNGFFMEKLRNIRVIKSFNTFSFEENKLKSISTKLIDVYRKNTTMSSLNSNVITFFVAVGPLIVLIYGGRGVFAGTMTLGALIAFIQYLNRLYSPTINIMNNYNQLIKSAVSMERVGKYINFEKAIREKLIATNVENFKRIEFADVTLVRNANILLDHISLSFEKGKIYGVIGPSGAGKSSFINAICGFMKPDTGSICTELGTSVYEIENWSDSIGLIEKENQLFNGTIYENIRYGSFNATESDVQKASDQAGFTQVINKLQEGYKTVINETGTILSDGQKQRISIARALLKKPPIIIFDESTSTLDLELEKSLIVNLRASYKDSIIIIITHRYNILKEFDYIYAFENGQLKRSGRPEEFKNEISF